MSDLLNKIKNAFLTIIMLLWLACVIRDYIQFRLEHNTVEAIITNHIWHDSRLNIEYTYSINSQIYVNQTPSRNNNQRRPKGKLRGLLSSVKTLDELQRKYPVGSKHYIYYRIKDPSISLLEYSY